MPKETIKEKEIKREKQLRYERGYRDYWWLLGIVLFVWILESPAVYGLIVSKSREHFNSYGVFMIVTSLVGHLSTVLLLSLDKRKASIIVSCITGALIILYCTLIYSGYERALNTSDLNILQMIISYIMPAVAVPFADIIMINRRL